MTKYRVIKQENDILLVEITNHDALFPMTFNVDDDKKFESLVGQLLTEDDIVIEEVFIGDESDESYQLIAKLK